MDTVSRLTGSRDLGRPTTIGPLWGAGVGWLTNEETVPPVGHVSEGSDLKLEASSPSQRRVVFHARLEE